MKTVSLELGDQVRLAWQAYKKVITTLVKVGLLSIGLYLLVMFGIFLTVVIAAFLAKTATMAAIILGTVATIIFIFVLIYVGGWANVAMQEAYRQSVAEDKMDGARQIFSKVKSKIIPLILVGSITGIMTMIAAIPFIIPALILAIWFSMATFVVVDGKAKGFVAVIKSRDYVKGRTGWVLLRMLFIAFAIPFVINLIVPMFLNMVSQDGNALILGNLVSGIFNLLYSPFQILFLWVMYEGLKSEKGELPNASQDRVNKYKMVTVVGFVLIALGIGVVLKSVITNIPSFLEKSRELPGNFDYTQYSDEQKDERLKFYEMYKDKSINPATPEPDASYTY